MGSNSSQTPAELSDEDIEFISSKAKIDHDSVKVWYEKLKVSLADWNRGVVRHRVLFQAACPNGKISKADTVSFLRSINSGKEDQIEKQASDIHKAFDANNDGIVGKCFHGSTTNLRLPRRRSTRVPHWFRAHVDRQYSRETQIRLPNLRSRQGRRDQ